MSKIKKLVSSALLLAVLIVLNRIISINSSFFVINIGFIPEIVTAIILGPAGAMLVFGLADYIGAHLWPFGEYFPGFTLTAVLNGLIYGTLLNVGLKDKFLNTKLGNTRLGKAFSKILLGKDATEKRFFVNLLVSSIIVRFIVNIFLQSFWLNILYGKAYLAVVVSRIVIQAITFIVQMIVGVLIYKVVEKEMKLIAEE